MKSVNSGNRPLHDILHGVIYYKAETPQGFVKDRAKNLGEEKNAELGDMTGVSILDSLLGAP
jgi:hypothetical protein